jgi:nucleoside-diphosphate-sugar epimerase
MDKPHNSPLVVVCGAGGFIGGHLVRYLRARGHTRIRAVDVKPLAEWHQCFDWAENLSLDLRERMACFHSLASAEEVYHLASDMGGMGFIEHNKALCMLNVLITAHLLEAARAQGVRRFFFSSTACVYAAHKQLDPANPGLREVDAYPAMPEDGYGWEKLFSERMCRHFQEDFGIVARVARYHNVYGPHGTYDGGREKAPAAICRKVIAAKLSGRHEIEIWGDGEQTRSFMFIEDCLKGSHEIMRSGIDYPINLGSDQLISINQLVDLVEEIAGITLRRTYNRAAPQGVRGRKSDNTLIRRELGWAPDTPLREGLRVTYDWIWSQMVASERCTRTA